MITNRQSQILTSSGSYDPSRQRQSTQMLNIPLTPASISPSFGPRSPLSQAPAAPPPYQPEPTPSTLERSMTSLTGKTTKDARSLPFPRWFTLSTRGFLSLLELGMLGYGIFFLTKYASLADSEPSYDKNRHELAVATFGLAAALDISVIVVALLKRYGLWGYWMFVMLVDLCIAVMGVVAAVRIYMVHLEHGELAVEEHGMEWEDQAKVLGLGGLVCGVFHILACMGGCAGCCIVTYRQKERAWPPKFY
ncbi:hypothetical protein V8F06_009414 [Rhypophila decipiens]